MKKNQVIFEISSPDIGTETAVAKVKDNYIKIIFVDTLAIIKMKGNWTIQSKRFEVRNTI